MVRKRSAFDPLEPTTAPRLQVVRNRQGSVVASKPVPPGTDLKRLLIELMLQAIDAGWEIREFSSTTGQFFCTRHPERRQVSISPTDPYDTHSSPSMYGPFKR